MHTCTFYISLFWIYVKYFMENVHNGSSNGKADTVHVWDHVNTG